MTSAGALGGTEEFEVNQGGNTRKVALSAIEAVIDHGSIAGLGGDDHTQYILVDGTRNFSGAVEFDAGFTLGGHTPTDILVSTDGASTSDTVLVTPGWIDANVSGGTSDHGGLTGLGDDDHTQYILVDGTRAMTGDLNMDGNNIDLGTGGRLYLDDDADSYIYAVLDDDVRLFVGVSAVARYQPSQVTFTPFVSCSGNFRTIGNAEIDGDLNHDGSNVGFYGTAPVTQQTGVAVSAAGIHAALVNLGLITA